MTIETITLTVTTDDPMLAALLRLLAAHGLVVEADGVERTAPDEPLRLLLSAEIGTVPTTRTPSLPTLFDVSVVPLAAALPEANTMVRQPPPTLAEQVVRDLAQVPRYSDVCRSLLRPMVTSGWRFDPDTIESTLTRLAEEFSAYSPRQLDAAMRHLARGRHRDLPDRQEVLAAIGTVSRPGYRIGAETEEAA